MDSTLYMKQRSAEGLRNLSALIHSWQMKEAGSLAPAFRF